MDCDGVSVKTWADQAIEYLQLGSTVTIKPHGNSMLPRIKSGQKVTLNPVDPTLLKVGDVVLAKVKGKVYLHLVSAISARDGIVQISNNKGHVNGWVPLKNVYGKAEGV
jgi:hypothetical protein